MRGDDAATKRISCNNKICQYFGSPTDRSRPFKRAKTSLRVPSIDDLSNDLLVEILLRLPWKSLVRCKCVSKRWSTLNFEPRVYLQGQGQGQEQGQTLMLVATEQKFKGDFLAMSHDRPLKLKISRFSLSFVPCFQAQLEEKATVVGTHNNLILCCETQEYQRDYYICNPYTKQWVALPRTPRCHKVVRVGFICDRKRQQTSVSTSSCSFSQLNAEYRCKVLRIPDVINMEFQFTVEIYSSETGEWRESIVLCPRNFSFRYINPGLAYNKMLYWSTSGDFVIGFDMYNSNNITTRTSGDTAMYHRFVEFDEPSAEDIVIVKYLGVCRERLRLCHLFTSNTLCVWQLEEQEQPADHENNPIWWRLMHKVCLDDMFSQKQLTDVWIKSGGCMIKQLVLDPHNEDIIYLSRREYMVVCNIRTRVTKIARKRADGRAILFLLSDIFPFTIPWWRPTPIPTLRSPHH